MPCGRGSSQCYDLKQAVYRRITRMHIRWWLIKTELLQIEQLRCQRGTISRRHCWTPRFGDELLTFKELGDEARLRMVLLRHQQQGTYALYDKQ